MFLSYNMTKLVYYTVVSVVLGEGRPNLTHRSTGMLRTYGPTKLQPPHEREFLLEFLLFLLQLEELGVIKKKKISLLSLSVGYDPQQSKYPQVAMFYFHVNSSRAGGNTVVEWSVPPDIEPGTILLLWAERRRV